MRASTFCCLSFVLFAAGVTDVYGVAIVNDRNPLVVPGQGWDSGNLQDIFDGMTGAPGSIGVASSQVDVPVFDTPSSFQATFVDAVAYFAPTSKFGIFALQDPAGQRAILFDGIPGGADEIANVDFVDGSVYVNGELAYDSATAGDFGDIYGFFIDVYRADGDDNTFDYTHYSYDPLNPNDTAQSVLYAGEGQLLPGATGNLPGNFGIGDYIIAFEDLDRSGLGRSGPSDDDFQDIVVYLFGPGTIPMPEPASFVAWLAVFIVGVIATRRIRR